MKYLLFVCLAAAVAFSGEAGKVLVRGRSANTYMPRESAYELNQRVNRASRGSAAPAFSLGKTNDDLPVVNTAQSFEKYDHHEAFLGPSVGDIFGDAELTKAEVVVLVGSGLGSLMEASLHKTYGTGLQEFRDVSLAMIKAGRKVLEDRVANGIPVSEERFENLRKVEERMSAVLDALAATFDQNEHTVYSLSRFFEDFDFQPEERSRYLARVLPTISKAVFQVDDTTTAEKLRDAYNIFLPATRKFVEERIEEGKPVTEQQLAMLERAEQLMPPLMQAYVTVVHDPFLVNFMQKLNLTPRKEQSTWSPDSSLPWTQSSLTPTRPWPR
ncbi:uncharacterized protein LOC127006523 isoform X3 [Eriocheir sinensis]|uniref:uncharacterized protein LOC127006523 isoform X3 n=1 Tax=Eriocheir sinensis TaxID=95602 RepID=UPI0021C93B53|nr:uncharacterized protein LOC127006523 isoform X3 [Eriocheir sinensis]